MNKYKVRSTIYLVFLLVCIIIIILLGYMLIINDSSDEYSKEVDLDVNEIYTSVYKFISEEKLLNQPVDEEDVCLNVDFTSFDKYFTERCIKDMQSFLIYENNGYYDCNNNLKNNLYNSILGSKKDNIKVIMSDDDKVLIGEENLSSYMLLVKENDKWLVDSYE